MFVDSHCHLDFPDLSSQLPDVLARMQTNHVTHALVVSVNLPDWPRLLKIVQAQNNLYASVGVHPDYQDTPEPDIDTLLMRAQDPKVIAIGETGLDYYRLQEPLDWQRERFRTHIRAARAAGLPLIIHTRQASADTLRIMAEEGAQEVGGVMHCFSEDWEVAQAAMQMNFYISLSGIVTFKNAHVVHDVARRVPLTRLLIETDAPYLAPVPHRGKLNDPSLVCHTAQYIADLKGIPLETLAQHTTDNFFTLFAKAAR